MGTALDPVEESGYPKEVVVEPVGIAVELVRLVEAVANKTDSLSVDLEGVAVRCSSMAAHLKDLSGSSLS